MFDWVPLTQRDVPSVGCLYIIRHRESGKLYVGKTVNLRRRMISHRSPERNKGSLLTRAVLKYGPEAFEIRIYLVDEADAHLLEMEKILIADLNTMDPHGYNLTAGGEGHSGHYPSAETRAKLSAATVRLHTGRKRSAETCARIGDAKRGKSPGPHSDATKAFLRDLHLGKPNLKKGGKGEKNGMYGVRGGSHPAARVVAIWQPETMLPKVFESVTEAAAFMGVTSASICDWCVERYRPKSGWVFAYLE